MSHSAGGGGMGHGGGMHHGGHNGHMGGGHPDQSPSWNSAVQSLGEKLKGQPLSLQNMPNQTLVPVFVALIVFVLLAIPYFINWNNIEPGREAENLKAEADNQKAYGSAMPGTAAGQDAHIQSLQNAVIQAPSRMQSYAQSEMQDQQAQLQQYGQGMQAQSAQPQGHIWIEPQGQAQQAAPAAAPQGAYAQAGYGQSYQAQGYAQQGYAPQAYAPQGYAPQAYAQQQAYAPQALMHGHGFTQQLPNGESKFKVFVNR